MDNTPETVFPDLPVLNFPPLDVPVGPPLHGSGSAGKPPATQRLTVFDNLRRKWVALTPEEWVRQHFTRWLIRYLGYPPSMMANEVGIKLNGMTRRCDTVVYTRSLRPLVIVEYKAPGVDISQRVFDQIVRYNMVCEARCLIVSNGLVHYCCFLSYDPPGYTFLRSVPSYGALAPSPPCP